MICPRGREMLKRLLSTDEVGKPDVDDQQHIATCIECRTALAQMEEFETSMGALVHEAKKQRVVLPRSELPAKAGIGIPRWLNFFTDWRFATFFLACFVFAYLFFGQRVKPKDQEMAISRTETTAPQGEFVVLSGKILLSSGEDICQVTSFQPGGDLIRCPDKASIRFPNGVEIAFHQAEFFLRERELKMISGKVRVKAPKQKIVFSVSTSVVVLGVRGTAFSVQITSSGDTHLAVTEGWVQATTVAGGEFEVRTGNSLVVKKDGIALFSESSLLEMPNLPKAPAEPSASSPGIPLGDALYE